MKELAIKIYNNTKLYYSLGLSSGLFLMFMAFKDLSDFITRESVLSFSFFTTIMFSSLLIKELSKGKESAEEIKEEQVSKIQEYTQPALSFNDSIEEEKIVYEWEEEDIEEQNEETIQTEEEPDTNSAKEDKEDPVLAGFTPEKEDDPFG